MRYWAFVVLGALVFCVAGCHSCGGHGLWSRLTGRGHGGECTAAPVSDCGCATAAALPAEAEPILTAPQKLNSDVKKDGAGFAEQAPFVPKKN